MSDTVQITNDDEPFALQQEEIDSSIAAVRNELSRISLTQICLECGEPIGKARLAAVPSATKCIDCASLCQRR